MKITWGKKMHRNRAQRGFTLIEIMIVVTILGVLASLAIPAYKDYTIRSKISEAANVFAPVKTAYSVYVSRQGRLPSNLSQVSLLSDRTRDFSGDYVQWLRIQNNGRVRIRTNDMAELGPAADKIFEFRPEIDGGSRINWTVFTRNNRTNWIPSKYLPSL